MRRSIAALLVLAAVFLAAAQHIAADTTYSTVIVTPSDIQSAGAAGSNPGPASGWAFGTQSGPATPVWHGTVVGGLVWDSAENINTDVPVGAAEPPLGSGSLLMTTGYDDSDPLEKIYVGTNNHSGVALADIVTLKYYTLLMYRDYGDSGTPLGQPPMVEITTDSGSTQQERTFVFKPYGATGNSNGATEVWQEWDLMAGDGTKERWELLHTSSTNYYGNWSWVVNRYPGLKLKAPYVGDYTTPYSADYHLSNQSGTSIAFKIGSGLAQDNRYGAWWRESCAIRGLVDKLVIGIKDSEGNVTEYTYDFEPFTHQPVALSNRSYVTGSASNGVVRRARWDYPFTIFGKILDTDFVDQQYFTVDDGSGTPVKVWAIGNALTAFDAGRPVRVEGQMLPAGNGIVGLYSRDSKITLY